MEYRKPFSDIKRKRNSLYYEFERMKELNAPVIISFSGGRDSIVVLDMFMKEYKAPIKVVYYYWAPDLSYEEKMLKYYETRYGITIERRPSWYFLSYLLKRQVLQNETWESARKEFGIHYIVTGIKMSDSVIRSMWVKKGAIDEKNGYMFPLKDWITADENAYIRQNRLVLPEEYQEGLTHNLDSPDSGGLEYIRKNYPKDYAKLKKVLPLYIKTKLVKDDDNASE